MRIHYNQKLKQRSRNLRNHATLAEVLFWNQVKGRKLAGYQFMRQKPIGDCIVDFYCSKLRLVVEVDGESHSGRREFDKIRQASLESLGLTVIRFLDCDVKRNMAGCITVLNEFIAEFEAGRIQPPNPLC